MSELMAHGSEITNIFQLIGMLENDITKSIAWALCKCPAFLSMIIDELLNIEADPEAGLFVILFFRRKIFKKVLAFY